MRSLDRIFRRNKPNLKTLAQWVKGLFSTGVNGAWYDPSDINLTWRRNLLTYSEQFDNAAWTKTGASVSADAATAPDGTASADKLVEDNSTGVHRAYQTPTVVASTAYTYSVFVKAAGRTQVRLLETTLLGAIFDVVNGVVSSVDVGITAAINSAGNGWYKCSITSTTGGAQTFYANQIQIVSSGNNSYTGDGTSGIYIWGAQLEVGSTATPYQRITDGIKDYLDYNPLPILYQDAAGTVPVTAVGQPVGLMLDKSKGLVLGPELVTNGNFSDGATSWSLGVGWAIVGGQAVRTPSSFGSVLSQPISVTAGKTYKVTYTITSYAAQVVQVIFSGGTQVLGTPRSSVGTFTEYLTANAGNNTLWMTTSNAATSLAIDNISVRELPGNHAFNPSGNSANFPVLSARYNLLTNTGFSGAVAGTPGTAPTGWTFGVSGGSTSIPSQDVITMSVASSARQFLASPLINIPANTSFVVSFIVTNYVGSLSEVFFTLNLTAGSLNSFSIPTAADFQIGVRKFIAITSGASGATFNVRIGCGSSANSIGAMSVSFTAPDLRVANDALNQPAYQRVNTATDYDTVGFKPYLAFNGTNQWLQTNSIDFTYGDKMFVCAGVRKLSDAAMGMVSEHGVGGVNINQWQLAAPRSASATYGFVSSGSSSSNATSLTSFAAPITNVLSGIGDISGDQALLRVNGTQAASSSADQGTGNYGNYPLYIGARAGTSLFFNGRLYGLVVAGKQASAGEITSCERYLNQKTGAY